MKAGRCAFCESRTTLCILSETPNDPRSTVNKQKRDKKKYTSKINQEDPSPRRFNFREALGGYHHKSNPRHSNRPQQYGQHADSLRSFHRLHMRGLTSLRSQTEARPSLLLHLLKFATQSVMREIYAPNLRNGTIAVTLQEFRYLTTEDLVIE
jgi:hypothetical protein